MSSAELSRRVVITGVGLVSPLGNTTDSLWDGLISQRSGARDYDLFHWDSVSTRYAAQATEFTGNIADFGNLEKDQKKMIRKALKLMCRETRMGVAAAQASLQDAGINLGNHTPDRSGCIFGTDYMLTLPDDFISGVQACAGDDGQFAYDRWGSEGLAKVTPLWLLKYLPNMSASHVAIYNDLRGPNNSLTLREAAANMSVGEAFFTIARGSADMMVVGATGTRIQPMNAIHAMQQEELANGDFCAAEASRPFDRDRSGMVLGEGAGAVVLEELQTALNRNAQIYGEVVARASSTVLSRQSVSDRTTALKNVLLRTLKDAGLRPEQVGHIHAHGVSTRSGDRDEAQAIHSVFGKRAEPCPVTAAKSYFGNLGAGSGMVEIIASLLACRHGVLFPIRNYQNADPDCPIEPALTDQLPPGDNFVNLSVTPQAQAAAILVRAFT
ncbi:MAG: beta-ketoacyl-[acyl-carrier-protein] synthase family protein [Planctomycetales bacterium]